MRESDYRFSFGNMIFDLYLFKNSHHTDVSLISYIWISSEIDFRKINEVEPMTKTTISFGQFCNRVLLASEKWERKFLYISNIYIKGPFNSICFALLCSTLLCFSYLYSFSILSMDICYSLVSLNENFRWIE